MIRKVVLLVAILGLGAPAVAQTRQAAATVASDPLRPRAQALLGILGGGGDTAAEFDPTFLAQIPDAKIRTIAKQLSDAFGAPLAIESLTATTCAESQSHRPLCAWKRGDGDDGRAERGASHHRPACHRYDIGRSVARLRS